MEQEFQRRGITIWFTHDVTLEQVKEFTDELKKVVEKYKYFIYDVELREDD